MERKYEEGETDKFERGGSIINRGRWGRGGLDIKSDEGKV